MTTGGTRQGARTPGTLGGLVLALLPPFTVPAEEPLAQPAAPDRNRVIAEVLEERVPESGEMRDAAVARIVELGREAVPDVCSLLFERTLELRDPARTVAIDRSAEALLVDALRAWPSELVVEQVVEGADERSLSGQLRAVRLVGELGDADTLESFLALLDSVDPANRQHAVVRDAVEAAFAQVLLRDQSAYDSLRPLLRHLDPAHLESLVRAFGATGSGAGIGLLGQLMDRSRPLDLAVLEALGDMTPWDPRTLDGHPEEIVVFHLGSLDPRVRRQAALALGRLRDTSSVHLLIDMLEDSDARARAGALWALREITGLRLAEDRERWARYQQQELEWLANDSDALVQRAVEGDTYASVNALREISSHPLFKSQLSSGILPALKHADETAVVSACEALTRLGDPASVPVLITTLEDPREAVRDAAHRGLRSITGAELAAEPAAWREWLVR